ncbi:hypothetical protein EIN_085580 [Entamoeba invadens IP1]|uniref:hypothetical protein n=1 Tax=Entamoeba invadens IP1 TaxID=370355 RepID=UPI0002C3E1F8|nr:hypothetical protein EIN_085580 [Entamoeba invadens IP1]ELP85316.1 hypothetical protein EIN_085580 [Entamoeba invadens IP1]|eukprot:XP_004184662.1 hypothetical protein EIN_085580 [Entamoeba invadens IP1]
MGFLKIQVVNKIVLFCATMLMSFGITIIVVGVAVGLYLDKLFELFSILPSYSFAIYQYAGSALFLLSISALIHAVAKYNKPVLIILFFTCIFVGFIEVWSLVTAYQNMLHTPKCIENLYDTTTKGIRREINLKFACCGWKTYNANSCSFTATDRKVSCYDEMIYPINVNYIMMIVLITIATLFLIVFTVTLGYQFFAFPLIPPKKNHDTNPLLSQ